MIRTGMLAAPVSPRVKLEIDGGKTVIYKSQLIVSSEHELLSPNAFLAEQAAGAILRPHFHRNQQFQVVIGGEGTLGRHALKPLTVHYSAPQTAYGPIVAGEAGLSYLTLRPAMESGSFFLPEKKDEMDRSLPKSQSTSREVGPLAEDALATLKAASVETMLEPAPNGLAAWLVRLPPLAEMQPPFSELDGGRFYVVTSGGLGAPEELKTLSIAWVSEEPNVRLTAGPKGAEVLVLQFPLGTAAH